MGSGQQFTKEFKEAIVKKLLARGNQTITEFCNQNNVALSTVTRWKSEYASVSVMKHKSRYSAEQILKIISEAHGLSEEDLGMYLRKNGLHSNQLTEWRANILSL